MVSFSPLLISVERFKIFNGLNIINFTQISAGGTTTYKAVYIVNDPEKIKLLADYTREEILRLLSIQPMTETQLSKKLRLTKAAVSYHLHLLSQAKLIRVEKIEVEKHGILQKYYLPTAALFIVDPQKIPKEVNAYFIQNQIQYLRGIFSLLKINRKNYSVSSKALEKLAFELLKQLKKVSEKFAKIEVKNEDVETIRMKIYSEALTNLMKQKEWKEVIKKGKA